MLESTLKDSISHHRLADVEMGSFLSGGIDSSYLAANSQVKKLLVSALKIIVVTNSLSPRIISIFRY